MGTFVGHIVPGSFFFLHGVWTIIQVYRRYFRCLQRNEKYRSTVSYCWRADNSPQYPTESAFKIIAAVLGICGEVYTGFEPNGRFSLSNGQHITMYVFFGLSGVVDIVAPRCRLLQELHVDYVIFAMAFAVELFLFRFHLRGRVPLDVQVHQLLILAIACNLICAVIEAVYQDKVLAALGRGYFVILQGTWFIQLGFILYNPLPNAKKWEDDDEEEITLVSNMFVWHSILVFIGVCTTGLILGMA